VRERGEGVGPRWLRGPEEEVGRRGRGKKRGRRVAGLGREDREKEFKEVFSFFSKLFFLNLFNFSNF
jgi:hypothetical protein